MGKDKLKPDFPFPASLARQAPQTLPLKTFISQFKSTPIGPGFGVVIPSQDPDMKKKFESIMDTRQTKTRPTPLTKKDNGMGHIMKIIILLGIIVGGYHYLKRE